MNLRTNASPQVYMRQNQAGPFRIQQGHNTQLSIEVIQHFFNFVLAGIFLRGNELHNSSRLGKRIAGRISDRQRHSLARANEHTTVTPLVSPNCLTISPHRVICVCLFVRHFVGKTPVSLHTYRTFRLDISFSSKSRSILAWICFSSLCCKASLPQAIQLECDLVCRRIA